jgi:hypothetical protein
MSPRPITAICSLVAAALVGPAWGAASPIASGFGSDGPYAGQPFTTFTIANPVAVAVAIDPVRIYVANQAAGRRPLLAIAHGYGGDLVLPAGQGHLPLGYPDLVRFALGKGWSVVFVPYPNTTAISHHDRYEVLWQGLQAAVNDPAAGARIDTGRIAIFGHSFGGGAVSWLAWQATAVSGWGGEGACAMICAPWFAFRMTPERFAALPPSLAVLTQVYDQDTTNDHAMAIEIYRALPQAPERRDYVLVSDGVGPPADHAVPTSGGPNGELDAMDWYAVYRPLEALCELAWYGSEAGRDTALGHGSPAQVAMPAPATLTSLWSAPVARQPAAVGFPWSDRDLYQPPPSVALEPPPPLAVAGTPIALSASANATTPGAAIERVAFSVAGLPLATVAVPPYTATWSAAGAGTVPIVAEAMDENGRTATATGAVEVAPSAGPAGVPAGTALPPIQPVPVPVSGSSGGSSGCGQGGLAALAAALGAFAWRRRGIAGLGRRPAAVLRMPPQGAPARAP